MEDARPSAAGRPAGLHLRLHAGESLPEAFVPLRLLLQPGGATIDVDRPDVLVGRHTECDVRLPLPDVSRRHCRLQFVEGCWHVMDLNSLNGIQVNGEAVIQAALRKGDRLKIGGFTFVVEMGGEEAPRPGGHVESVLETLAGWVKRKAS
jgi:pSer/pThr/pTyr-binding forkhead associated (FHA) protein